MIFDVISDLHFDYDFLIKEKITEEKVKSKYDEVFQNRKSDILLIAGDIGHYNDQNISILKIFLKIYYKKIVFVFGNHDRWLLSNNVKKRYKTSKRRLNDMKNKCYKIPNLYLLDGDVIELSGVKIGGAGMWYDGSFFKFEGLIDSNLNADFEINGLWHQYNNDPKKITCPNDLRLLYAQERKKLLGIYKESDIIMTHMIPTFKDFAFPEGHGDLRARGFLSFDGEEIIKETTASCWIYGHAHGYVEYEYEDIHFIANAMGGNQNKVLSVITIEVNPK